MSTEPFLGDVQPYAGTYPPRGWMFCEGQLLAISQFSALFSILGTQFGGDGRTTFALPDLRGRSPAGATSSSSPYTEPLPVGARRGTETVILNEAQLGAHFHSDMSTLTLHVQASIEKGDVFVPENGSTLAAGYDPGTESDLLNYIATGTTVQLGGVSASCTATVGNTGGVIGHPNMQPWQCVHFIIATQGLFPSRN